MDHTEDLSARVLLKNILSTEPPRTPITRSASKVQSTSGTRRSNRLSKKDAGARTPQDILRRSLKHKMRESITRKSLPATTRKTASFVLRKANTPGPASVLFDDGDTPRHILRNILRTEPVRSPVVHDKAVSEGPQLPSANSSITSKRPSMELSGLDLPDLTIGNTLSTGKGLSRKRPRRSLNVTAFEKRLKDGKDVEEENEESISEQSSLSLSSSTSLSLKTPFVDVQTEKRGLQRKVSNRRKITEEEFGAAVNRWQMGNDHGVSSVAPVQQGLQETTYSDGFTLGLSELSEPDITTDVVNCNTALYTQPDSMASSFHNVATQDKPTVMASQLQRQMRDITQMEAEQSKLGKDKSMYVFPTEEEVMAQPQNEECASELHSEKAVDAAECQKEEWKSTDGHPESQSCVSHDTAESEEEENRVEAQTEEEGAADPHSEGYVASRSQSEEEDVVPDSQTEGEEGGVDSQPKEDVAARSQSEEKEVTPDSQTEEEEEGAADSQSEVKEEGAVDSQSEEDGEDRSLSEEEGDAEEDHSDQEEPAASSIPEENGDVAESQAEDGHDGKQEEEGGEQVSEQVEHDLEHISRRAHRSEGGLIMPVTEADATEAGWSEGKSEELSATDLHRSLETGSHESSQPHVGMPDLVESSTHGQEDASCTEAKPSADKENSFHLLQVTHDIEDSRHLHNASPEEAAAEDPAEQEEEWEDEEEDGEETEEFPCTTPAFVREKRTFFRPDPLDSPSVLKNIQASSTSEALPAAKPKQVRRKRAPTKKEAGLPKNYLMGVFKHFAKTKVSADVYPALKEIMDKFFDRLADDLETYASHAKRKTIDVEDAELLLKRQGYVNDKVPVEVLIEKYLRMEQRKLLIPIATSGNVVIPKKQR
ncbi:centromere protein T [Seriola lalandi dorsalis]|uniref:Centromere protein T n=1 Tax=Seriola lalandi dorsalis TaxID=1841481 RepID=A0A3B4YKP5_SERLL|nr:centromere protein T [Seriola lalandi dorsalis]